MPTFLRKVENMCTFNSAIAKGIFEVASVGSEIISGQKQAKSNNEYRVQLALNNAQNARNEAYRQKQLGIDNSRKEKIEGIREANKLKARNSANGIDVASVSSNNAYEDVLNDSAINADLIKNQYELSSNNLFEQSKSYVNQAKAYNNNYNNSLFSNALNALGKTSKVASSWFDNGL